MKFDGSIGMFRLPKSESHPNYPTVGTVPTPNIKIEEIRKIDTSSA
jgi:hypothetical protein